MVLMVKGCLMCCVYIWAESCFLLFVLSSCVKNNNNKVIVYYGRAAGSSVVYAFFLFL